jgi:hypothetical protein
MNISDGNELTKRRKLSRKDHFLWFQSQKGRSELQQPGEKGPLAGVANEKGLTDKETCHPD